MNINVYCLLIIFSILYLHLRLFTPIVKVSNKKHIPESKYI